MKLAKIEGYLEYWNGDLLDPVIEMFDLTRRMATEIVIGNNYSCTLNILDLEANSTLTIKSTREGGLILETDLEDELSFINKEKSVDLQDGDIFKFGNHTFKYFKGADAVE